MDRKELYKKIEMFIFEANPSGRIGWKKLQSLVQLHEPVPVSTAYWCPECRVPTPCPTIDAIEKDLA